MTYALNGLIQATDYNTLVCGYANGVNNPAVAALNSFWSVGSGSAGYGHAPTSPESIGNTVVALNRWANLVSKTANAATHQGSSITSVSTPVAGGTITYVSAIPTNLTTVFNNKLNAATQGGTFSNSAQRATSWSSAVTATHTVTFSSGDAARYFFNAGGQIAITNAHPAGSGINSTLYNLGVAVGTVVISAPSSGIATIASTNYNGITKIGGSGTPSILSTNSGYYSLSSANLSAFKQDAGGGGYLDSYIHISIKTNGTVGTNGDKGSILTIYTLWDEVPNGLVASSGTTTTVTVKPPETTNIANNWGAITISGTMSGS
jgi:hypothetical protein